MYLWKKKTCLLLAIALTPFGYPLPNQPDCFLHSWSLPLSNSRQATNASCQLLPNSSFHCVASISTRSTRLIIGSLLSHTQKPIRLAPTWHFDTLFSLQNIVYPSMNVGIYLFSIGKRNYTLPGVLVTGGVEPSAKRARFSIGHRFALSIDEHRESIERQNHSANMEHEKKHNIKHKTRNQPSNKSFFVVAITCSSFYLNCISLVRSNRFTMTKCRVGHWPIEMQCGRRIPGKVIRGRGGFRFFFWDWLRRWYEALEITHELNVVLNLRPR